jgi:hypothetical protein
METTFPALDVWFYFDSDETDEATMEANTYKISDNLYRVMWSHTAVGLLSAKDFESLEDAHSWLIENGYQDFSS